MSDIGDLFGEYATPFKKKILDELSKKQEPKPGAKTRHITHTCSYCGSQRAWHSSDHGATWQCFNHKK